MNNKLAAVVLLHFDMFPELPVQEIILYARRNHLTTIGMQAYRATNISDFDLDMVIYPHIDGSWPRNLAMITNCIYILITGGYRDLCVHELQEYLAPYSVQTEISNNPEWVIDNVHLNHINQAIESFFDIERSEYVYINQVD